MNIKIQTVLILIVVFLLGISLVKASNHVGLSCQVIDNSIESCGGVAVFKISGKTNAHSEIPSQSNFNYDVCCQNPGFVIGNSCDTGFTILKLSSSTNAHVEKNTLTNYNTNVCLSLPASTDLSCEYKANCGDAESCLATISADTNAKAADCVTNPYPTKICCQCSGTVSGFVEDIGGNRIGGAKIQIMNGVTEVDFTFTSSGPTPPLGEYTIDDLTCGTYDMIASADDYISSTKSNVVLPSQESLTVDFTGNDALVLGSTCEDDCTTAADDIIHQECHEINDCAFYDATAKKACNFAQPGWVRDYVDTANCPEGGCIIEGSGTCVSCSIECPEGIPQRKIETKASVTCELENLLKLTKVVVYKGKLAKLNIVTCG